VVALAGNLDLLASRFLTSLTAIVVVSFHPAPAWQVCTFLSRIRRSHWFSFATTVSLLGRALLKTSRKSTQFPLRWGTMPVSSLRLEKTGQN
jgi:hypothetical protein